MNYLCKHCHRSLPIEWWEVHHKHCKKKENAGCVLLIIVILSLFILLFVVLPAHAEQMYEQKDWVKGAVVIGVSNSGSCVFKPFIKTGDADNNPDDDTPQILGYEPGNVVIHNGTVVWERVAEAQFLRLGQHKSVHGRLCSCPPYNE